MAVKQGKDRRKKNHRDRTGGTIAFAHGRSLRIWRLLFLQPFSSWLYGKWI